MLAATLAYLARRGEEPFSSATFLTTQIDFTKAGDLKVFIDDGQLHSLEAMMQERGYLDGSRMANVFNMLRPRDLIWPYIINNYMLGKKPFPFDLLYWNQDSTRLPAANHQFYLRAFYHDNLLAKGEMKLCGVDLDMTKVTLPVYELAAREDHIAPAESVLKGAKLFSGPVEYVLAGSGHIAGVVQSTQQGSHQVSVLDEPGWPEGGFDRELAKDSKRNAGFMVGTLDRLACRTLRRKGSRARTWQDRRHDRGCARFLRQAHPQEARCLILPPEDSSGVIDRHFQMV